MVLVQGTARVDERRPRRQPRALRARVAGEAARRRRRACRRSSSRALHGLVLRPHLRPRAPRARLRVGRRRPRRRSRSCYDSHLEEVRSGHDEEPEAGTPAPRGRRRAAGTRAWTSWATATRPPCSRSSPRRLPVLVARARRPRPGRAGAVRIGAGRARRADAARPGLPHRPRPRARLHLAAQLPGPRRPRRRRRRLGAASPTSWSAASSCRRPGRWSPAPRQNWQARCSASAKIAKQRASQVTPAGDAQADRRRHRPDRRHRQARSSARSSAPAPSARSVGMARRPFDPELRLARRPKYRQGDVLDRDAVDALVAGADVVVHLAFIILGAQRRDARRSTSRARATSSRRRVGCGRQAARLRVVGRGLRVPRRQPDAAHRGHPAARHRRASTTRPRRPSSRPCSRTSLDGADDRGLHLPPVHRRRARRAAADRQHPLRADLRRACPAPSARLFDVVPILKPVIPDPGVPFQLVHHDDVATALRAARPGQGRAGRSTTSPAPGQLTLSDLADALGWYSVPVPDLAVDATAELASRLPFLPPEARLDPRAARCP